MEENEVWLLIGIYYEEGYYECEEVISVHAVSYSAYEQKKFLEKYSKEYDSYKLKCFNVLKENKNESV